MQLQRLQLSPSPPPQASNISPSDPPPLSPLTYVETQPDKWSLYRCYHEHPSRFSDETNHKDFACDALTFANVQTSLTERTTESHGDNGGGETENGDTINKLESTLPTILSHIYAPFKNVTHWLLMKWWYSHSSTTSLKDLNSLVHDIILNPEFRVDHLVGFSTSRELKLLDLPIT
jgi:hypothetical protein